MNTNTQAKGNAKKKSVTHIAILIVVVVSFIVIAFLLANSNFDFIDFMMRLHGG